MYGSGPLDGDDNYVPPSIPSREEQMKMVKQRRKADEKLREKKRKERKISEMKENIKRSFRRVGKRVKSFFNRDNRRSRPNTGPPLSTTARNAYDLYNSGQIDKVGGSKRKRRRNKTARKPKKRSNRTRRHKR